VNAQIQQRPASGCGAVDHPFHVLLIVPIHHSAHEFERQILNGFAPRDFLDRIDDGTIPEHQRHRREYAGGGGSVSDIARLGGIDGAGFLDRERDALADQEPRLVSHVAMPAQYESEVRIQFRAHFTVVGEDRTLRLRRQILRASDIGIADANDRSIRHRQHRLRIKWRMPVRDTNQNDMHWLAPSVTAGRNPYRRPRYRRC
jgi:hypothetical protein